MNRVLEWLKKPRHQAYVHLGLTGLWLLLLWPTITIWRESIFYIVFISWYANFVGHLAAWQAARGEQRQEASE